MRSMLRTRAIVGLAAAGWLLVATSAQAVNFIAFNQALGVGSAGGTPNKGPAKWTGTAMFTGMGPASFMVNAFDANWTTNVVNPTPPTAVGITMSTQFISVTGPTAPGTFKKNGGPGNFVFNPPPDPTYGARIGTGQVIKGPNQFGGSVGHTFKFLSKLGLNFGFAIFTGTFPLLEVQGVTTIPGSPDATQSFTGTFKNTQPPSTATQIHLRANFFGWTTGTAIGKDNGGAGASTWTITGYDNRTPNGLTGTLQLVSPVLFSSFNSGFFGTNHLSGVNYLRYKFLPEPGSTLVLAVGIGGLLFLRWLDRRRAEPAKANSETV